LAEKRRGERGEVDGEERKGKEIKGKNGGERERVP